MANEPTINLLLVDDHTIVTDGLTALLKDVAWVEIKGVAVNGNMALEMLRLLKVDVVLMDIDMPELNGIDATRQIKKHWSAIKVIMLTMHDEKAMIKQMKEIGADGYLLKNSPKNELLHAIRNVVNEIPHYSDEVTAVLLKPDEHPARNPKLAELTEREIEIIKLIAEGLSNKEIGEKLFISHRTVDTHRTNVMTKLNVHNVAGVVRFAIENGMMN